MCRQSVCKEIAISLVLELYPHGTLLKHSAAIPIYTQAYIWCIFVVGENTNMSTVSAKKRFLFATLSSMFICSLSCHKREDAPQEYIPISGQVYDTSLNKGIEGVWIFFGRRPSFYGIGNGPAHDNFDSVRTDSEGDYNYRLKLEDRKDYEVCCDVPPGYSYSDCRTVFWRRDNNGKLVPLTIDLLLVR